MEVDRSTLAPAGTQTSVTISVHPLVIMNISEHWTRTKAQAKGKSAIVPAVVGALLGKQSGRHIELCNSFELMVDIIDGLIIINKAFFTTREEQYKEVFSTLDFLGWYTTGGPPTQLDVHVHKQMCDINESPVFVKMDPTSKQPTGKLPLNVYESVLDIAGGETILQFVELPFDLVTEEAERIGVDHVAKITPVATTSVSTATKPLMALHGAVKMLFTRLKIITSYLEAVEEGKLERNDGIFREVNSLCARLPVLDSEEFKTQFQNQCNDITLMAYLGILTKTCGSMNQLVSKLNVVHDKHGASAMRRGRGILM